MQICYMYVVNCMHVTNLNPLLCHSEHEEQELSLLLLKFCQQIAEGMRYLSSMGFVHKELSARNIQLDESLNCKVCTYV